MGPTIGGRLRLEAAGRQKPLEPLEPYWMDV